MGKYGLLGKFIAVEGKRDTLVEILLNAAESMEDIADCELYVVSIANHESNAIYVYEVWKSEDAHKASLSLEATQTLIEHAKPLIAGMERIITLSPVGGKGIISKS